MRDPKKEKNLKCLTLKGQNLMHLVAIHSSLKCFKLLNEHLFVPELLVFRDIEGNTPLHWSHMVGNNTVSYLLLSFCSKRIVRIANNQEFEMENNFNDWLTPQNFN